LLELWPYSHVRARRRTSSPRSSPNRFA
jgi:hypothetical protein